MGLLGVQVATIPFDTYILSLAPSAWYKFQDANFNTATNLTDSSGNAKHLPRLGASAVAVGAALRNTTTKSANLSTNGSTNNHWRDTGGIFTSISTNAAALSLIFSFKRTTIAALAFAKIIGWRQANASNLFCGMNEFGNDHTSMDITLSTTVAGQVEHWIGNSDLNTHIYGVTYGGSQIRIFRNGALVQGPTSVGAALTATVTPFEIGGTMSSGSSAHFLIDHVSIFNRKLTDTEMINAQLFYNAEKLP